MTTMLENYYAQKALFDNRLHTEDTDPLRVWQQQEVLYRIEVLEAMALFLKTAPNTTDVEQLIPHYQMVDAYIRCLPQERRYGSAKTEELKEQQEVAYKSLLSVIMDYQKNFSSFAPTNDGHYMRNIATLVCTVAPVWIQFRDLYVEIKEVQA